MENTSGDEYWLNGNNEIHNIIIHIMVRSGLLDSNKNEKKWSCAVETSVQVHRCRMHSALDNISTHFSWYGKKPKIHELRAFGCDIYPIKSSTKTLYERTQDV